MSKYFIESVGQFKYNTLGIFYPYLHPIKFSSILNKHGIKKYSWCRFIDRKVVCFNSEQDLCKDSFGNDLPYGLKISRKNF
jgi:hypothetical protein